MDYLPGWNLVHWDEAELRTAQDYNLLLTQQRFWKYFLKYDRVLIFQHDSGLLRKGIEEFLEWEYVGAPWKPEAPWARKDRKGGNGGLSIRCPKKSLNLIERFPYHPRMGNEDVYFSHYLERVAPYEVCRRFSVETVFELGTLAYHAIDKYLTPEQQKDIMNQYSVSK